MVWIEIATLYLTLTLLHRKHFPFLFLKKRKKNNTHFVDLSFTFTNNAHASWIKILMTPGGVAHSVFVHRHRRNQHKKTILVAALTIEPV